MATAVRKPTPKVIAGRLKKAVDTFNETLSSAPEAGLDIAVEFDEETMTLSITKLAVSKDYLSDD